MLLRVIANFAAGADLDLANMNSLGGKLLLEQK
jgi:hypothetical protein